jgi:hypothetical protein
MRDAQLDSDDWSRLVERLGGEAWLASSARVHKAFVRARGIKSAVDVLRLALMYGPLGYSLRSLAATVAMSGLANVSDVAVMDRIRKSADWLQSLCKERLAVVAQQIGVTAPERPIRIVDGSRLEGPGNRVWRLHLCIDAALARIVDAVITTTREGERLDRLAVTAGEIRLGDRGFPQPDGIRNALASGADVLVRLTWNSLQLTAHGKTIDWLELFEQAREQGSLDMQVRLHKAHSRFEPLDMRLVIVQKPPVAAEKTRLKAHRASRKNQRRTDPRTLAGAGYLILLTSLKPEPFPCAQIVALYRLRWQIELAIKRLKSILHIDRLPAKDPDLVRAWLHAHLLFALLLDDIAAPAAFSPSPSGRATTLALAQDHSSGRRTPRRHLAAA